MRGANLLAGPEWTVCASRRVSGPTCALVNHPPTIGANDLICVRRTRISQQNVGGLCSYPQPLGEQKPDALDEDAHTGHDRVAKEHPEGDHEENPAGAGSGSEDGSLVVEGEEEVCEYAEHDEQESE